MKNLLPIVCIVAAFAACQQTRNSTDNAREAAAGDAVSPTSAARPATTDTANNTGAVSTDEFAIRAATGGMMEVVLGELAQQKATHPDVKSLAQTITADHRAANQELIDIARAKGVTLPTDMTSEQHQHHAELEGLSGAEFDRAYVQMMIEDHTQDIALYQAKANAVSSDAFRAFAEKTLPTLRKHLDMAKAAQQKLGS